MKRIFICLLCLVMIFGLVACIRPNPDNGNDGDQGNSGGTTDGGNGGEVEDDPFKDLALMTYEDYVAAAIDDPVYVEVSVQAHQAWWNDKITVYAADEDGAYFLYEMACSEEDAAKLVPGTKIAVKGYKGEWAGEVEIMDATFEFVEGEGYIAEPVDVTDYLGTDDLIDFQNQLVYFDSLTVEDVTFKNGGGDDIYLKVSKGGNTYSFCVEVYLTGTDSQVYETVSALKKGDVIHVEGFLYWYEGVNTHITAVYNGGVLSYEEYAAAKLNQHVKIEAYVQAHQSWWSNKVTVYAADEDGAYFIYELACSEEDAAKLLPGTKIRVDGYKAEWAGEVEIVDATFEFVDAEPYIATAKDVTEYLGTDELIDYQNQLVSFTDLIVEEISFKNDGGDDIYVKVSKDGKTYSFCVEVYLTGTSTEVYQTASALKAGDVIDVIGFLYWYEGVNTHITGITLK